MKTLTNILLISMFISGGIAQASQCPSTNVIEDPPVFQWSGNEGTLEIGEASFVIGGETLTTRAFRQEGGEFSIPGPTMYMSPGQTYVLTLKNSLPFEEPSPEHNTLKDPNITNIHTHGLHISGETPSDDVTRIIQGGYCGDYVYEIGPDHMGGTNWYHPHHHGSTWLQVAGGALGMLIVDDSGDGIPAGVAAMNERLLAVGFIEPGVVAGNGGDTLISGTFSSGWTVNGNVQGNLCTPVDEWQHWRVLLADPDAKMKDVEIGPECEAVLMARDGVWRTAAPMPLVNNTISLTGASRADLAVRCSADSTITVGNTVVANIYADPNLPANLTVGPYSEGATGGMWQAQRPSYLRDLRGETPDYTDSIRWARAVSTISPMMKTSPSSISCQGHRSGLSAQTIIPSTSTSITNRCRASATAAISRTVSTTTRSRGAVIYVLTRIPRPQPPMTAGPSCTATSCSMRTTGPWDGQMQHLVVSRLRHCPRANRSSTQCGDTGCNPVPEGPFGDATCDRRHRQ